jgi:hypothetical protein
MLGPATFQRRLFSFLGKVVQMDPTDTISQIRAETVLLAGAVTRIHPLVPGLQDAPTQAEILKALFELTKQVEVVKKQLMRLEKRDENALL